MDAAHRLWHQAEASYAEPDGFTANLNACIQALRSVTWVLQKGKRSIPDFDSWYAHWQDKMRADPILRWLVGARNRIEKQGDLETFSTVRVQVLMSYDEPPIRECQVDPLLSTEQIAKMIEAEDITAEARQDGMLAVERRWVVRDLPDRELLDALAYVYGFLFEVLSDAHVQLGLPPMEIQQDVGDGERRVVSLPASALRGRMPCMLEADTHRTLYVNLRTHETATVRTFRPVTSDEDLEEVAQRYGHTFDGLPAMLPTDLRQEVEIWLEMAKSVLQSDGHHENIILLRREGESVHVMRIQSEDRAEKYLNWRRVAKQVRSTGADVVITIGESWLAPIDTKHPDRPAADSPDRIEVLSVAGIKSNGEEFSMMVPFTREGGAIRFDEVIVPDDRHSSYLDPIRRVWSEQASSPASESDHAGG